MSKPRRRTWRIVAIVTIAAVMVLVLAVSQALKDTSYGFVSELGGEERSGIYANGGPSFDDRSRFLFHRSLAEVLPVMARDLARNGWRELYHDKGYAAFSRETKTGEETAFLEASIREGTENFDTSTIPTECYATLSPIKKNWVAVQVENLLNLVHGKKKPPTKPVPFNFSSGPWPFLDAIETTSNGRATAELTWFNRSPEPATCTVDNLYLRGYEPDQATPIKTSLAPWEIKKIEVTFPAEAARGEPTDPRNSLRGDYTFDEASDSGSGGLSGFGLASPAIEVSEMSGVTSLVIANDNQRPLEVTGLTVQVNGVTKLSRPGPTAILPGKQLRIKMPFAHLGKGSQPVIRASYRLKPNKRWHPMAMWHG